VLPVNGIGPPLPGTSADWLLGWWSGLSTTQVAIATGRQAASSLADLGRSLSLSRERVRQLEVASRRSLLGAQRHHQPELPDRMHEELSSAVAVPENVLGNFAPTRCVVARDILFVSLGAVRPCTWAGNLPRWWCRDPDPLAQRLVGLTAGMPMTGASLDDAVLASALPEHLPVQHLLLHSQSPIVKTDVGWVRRAYLLTDTVALYLRDCGAPQSLATLGACGSTPEATLRKALLRDDRFVYSRPRQLWALREWHPELASRYRNAGDALVDVLRDGGPLAREALVFETQRRYPVTPARLRQSLSSSRIGLHPDGRYDLVERGAAIQSDAEPSRPGSIRWADDGSVLEVALVTTAAVLSGAVVAVPRWLTWQLGLRTPPAQHDFALTSSDTLVVRRTIRGSSVSSLRGVAQELQVRLGCVLLLSLDLRSGRASVRHACHQPARTQLPDLKCQAASEEGGACLCGA